MPSACLAVGAAGAGAATGIYLTMRGIEGLATGTSRELEQHTRMTFDELGLRIVSWSLKEGGQTRMLRCVTEHVTVTVELRKEGPNMTLVEVTAKRDTLKWDKQYAKRVLEKIIGSRVT